MKTLIKNVRIVGEDRILEGHGLLVEKEKIAAIDDLDRLENLEFDRVLDGGNLYLAPGFIDIHSHGNSGSDIMDGSWEALDRISSFQLKHGVTSYLGTIITSSYEKMEGAIDNMVSYIDGKNETNLLGIHLEGPFFSEEKRGAQPLEHIRPVDLDLIKKLLDRSEGYLKMISLAPELEGVDSLIDYLRKKSISVAMGHSMASYKETKKAIEKGASLATHLYNGMLGFNHREPGIVGAVLLDDRVFCELIYDRIHVDDGAVELAYRLKTSDRLVLVSDSMRAAGLEDGVYELGGQKVIVDRQVARLEDSTLAGSLLSLDRAVYNMVNYQKLDLTEAVKMASLSPARALKLDKTIGSIEVGKDADLILIDENINVYGRILKGKLYE